MLYQLRFKSFILTTGTKVGTATHTSAYTPVPTPMTRTTGTGTFTLGPVTTPRGYFVLIRTTGSLSKFELADETSGEWKNSDLSTIMATSGVEVQWTSLESMAEMLKIYGEHELIRFLMKDV